MNYIFLSAEEVINVYGEPSTAKRKTLVKIRPTVGTEIFPREKGDLTAVEGIDYVVMSVDGSESYPCKIDIFNESWQETVTSGVYEHKALCRVIQVPVGDRVTLKTLEGNATITHPDYIAIGVKGEVYSNSEKFVKENLIFI
jgi:hypothetical protein